MRQGCTNIYFSKSVTKLSFVLAVSLIATSSIAKSKIFFNDHLKTGLEVVTVPSNKVPLVTIVLVSKAGGMTETPETNGLTHLWEHMFFKGNKHIPNQEAFNQRIRQLGIVYNGDTSAETVRYYFTLPSNYLEEGLEFMANAIATPLLEQKELEKERRVVMDEYDRSAASPSFDLRNLVRTMIYKDKSYLRDALGMRHLINQASREQLLKIKNEVFVPSNCALIIGGDIERKETMQLVNKYFGEWKDPKNWKPVKRPSFPDFPKTQSFVMTRPLVENAAVSIVFEGPRARSQKDDSYAADVMIHLLGHRSGKFYKKFIDSGLTFGARLGYYTQSQAGLISLDAYTKPEQAKKVEEMLRNEVKLWLQDGYFTQEQLEDVRRNLSINYLRETNQISEFTKSLAFWWSVTGLNYYGNYIDSLKKVSLKDIQTFVKRWLADKSYISSILVSPSDAKKAGLKDTSHELVKQYLSEYEKDKAMKKSPQKS